MSMDCRHIRVNEKEHALHRVLAKWQVARWRAFFCVEVMTIGVTFGSRKAKILDKY